MHKCPAPYYEPPPDYGKFELIFLRCLPKMTPIQFDDLGDKTPQAVPVPYNGLNFSGADIETDVNPYGHKLVIAESGDYYIEARGSTAETPYVSTAGTNTNNFDLDSFYLGCIDGRSARVSGCQFTVTGLNAADLGSQGPTLFTYDPVEDSNFSAPMQKFDIGFTGLKAFYVDVIANQYTLPRLFTAIDNVQVTTRE